MNREELQGYIYNEKLLAQLYRRASALTSLQDEKQALLSFANEAQRNAEYLNYFYRQEFGTSFDPIMPELNIQGSYRDVLNEIQKQELESFLSLRKLTYNQGDGLLRETIREISDTKLGHILTLLAIIANMNAPQED